MSKNFTKYSSTISTVSADYTFVATAKVGHQHNRAIDNSPSKLQICSGGGGILHKVDRGKDSSQYSSSRAQKVLLAKYNMPFWSAQKDNGQQCKAVWLSYIQGFLPSDGGWSSLRIRVSPLIEQSSGKVERTDIHSHTEDTGGLAERKMVIRIFKSDMEPQ
jgi:hypothetical protein